MGKASRAKRERAATGKTGAGAPTTSQIPDLAPAKGLAFDIDYLGERMSGHQMALGAIVEDDLFKLQLLQVCARALGQTILDMEFRIDVSETVAVELSILEVALAREARACLHFLLANCEDRPKAASNFLTLLFANAANRGNQVDEFSREFLKENFRLSRARGHGGEASLVEHANEMGLGAAAESILAEVMDEERAESDRQILEAAVPEVVARPRAASAL